MNEILIRKQQKIFANKKHVIYVLDDTLVNVPKQSSLFIELEKIKEQKTKKPQSIKPANM